MQIKTQVLQRDSHSLYTLVFHRNFDDKTYDCVCWSEHEDTYAHMPCPVGLVLCLNVGLWMGGMTRLLHHCDSDAEAALRLYDLVTNIT